MSDSEEAPRPPYIRHADGSVRQGRSAPGPFEFDLKGGRVDQCALDYALTLTITASLGLWTVRIEGEFEFTPHGSDAQRFESLSDYRPSSVAPVIDWVLHKTIESASAGDDGTLSVVVDDAGSLVVPPHPAFEAWQINGPDQSLVVCAPGGRLSIWSGNSEASA